ncbi:MAG: class I SAM-dependent methyltransferase [Maricaulaceae bacterium]|jgi:demethylmenaquinone methyltransferase/2-methoxy-6-polyprenyl-1,4-benzoquinol methylase
MTKLASSEPASPGDTASFGARDVPKAEKAGLVRGVFDSVAGKYDLMNDAMSLGVHRVWKDVAITRANPQPGELLIDVAGGTGDLSRLWVKKGAAVAKRRGGKPARAIVCDINEEMVRAGIRSSDAHIARIVGNAESLPFTDSAANAVTIGFGIRNVTDRAAALSEMHRVLKPGGRFVCLEFSRPTFGALETVYDAWSFGAIPRIGAALAGDRESYEYLVESIRRFPDQRAFAAEVEAAGFKRVSVTNLSGGVAALHVGWRV